jgi:hypothetical protein
LPTSKRSLDFTTPVKFVIATACPHVEHQTLLNNNFLVPGAMADQNFDAGSEKPEKDSIFMTPV